MRWEYPDPADVNEARERQPIIESMERWWEAFARHADEVDRHFSDKTSADFDVVGFTDEHLKAISPGLNWEYGEAQRKEGHRLVITTGGTHELEPMLRELLRRAPKLKRWEFYPYLLPEKPEVALAVAGQIVGKSFGEPKVAVSMGEARRIDLRFQLPVERGGEGHQYAIRVAEHLLGEEILDKWIDTVDVVAPPSALGKLMGRGREVGLVDIKRLKPTVDAMIAAGREQLSDGPLVRRAPLGEADDKREWYTLQLEPEEREDYPTFTDLFVAVTPERELWAAAHSDPGFRSERFSRCGETFCYLKIDGRDGPGAFADRGEMTEAVNAALRPGEVGCDFGGGTGRVYTYIDLAMTDVREGAKRIREVLRRGKVHRRSWLLFFDGDLAEEWVGIYDDTPAPPAPDREDEE